MKKSMIFAVAAMLYLAAPSYSQSTSSSGAGQDKKGQSAAGSDQKPKNTTAQTGATKNRSTQTGAATGTADAGATATGDNRDGKRAQNTTPGDGATRPGGASNENANDVGHYSDSDKDDKSMLRSKEAMDRRKRNMTEADTTMKEGSGASKRNMRNKTGKTGNYQNQQIKHDQKTQSRP